MGFGSAFRSAWESATEAGRQAALNIDAAAEFAAKSLADSSIRVKDAVVAGAKRSGEAVADAAAHAERAAVDAKNAAVAAAKLAREVVAKAGLRVERAAVARVEIAAKGVKAAAVQVAKTTVLVVQNAIGALYTDFLSYKVGAGICIPCVNKKPLEDRRADYQKLAQMARNGANRCGRTPAQLKKLHDAADRLDANAEALAPAYLAGAVYSENEAPLGSTRLDKKALDLIDKKLAGALKDENSEFRAAIFRTDDKPSRLILAFKGTRLLSLEDWENNLWQSVVGESAFSDTFGPDYYRRANRIGQILQDADLKGEKVVVTGHSLGGGMASAVGESFGFETYTYNAAGLNENTAPLGATKNIHAYHVRGEILTGAQATLPIPDAVGERTTLPAVDSSGRATFLPVIGMSDLFTLHLMPNVINGLESELATDELTVNTLICP